MTSRAISLILAKDFRRFWPLILCGVGFTALSTGLAFHPLPSSPFGGRSFIDVLPLPTVLRWFILIFISVAVTQDDPPDGDRGGWLARPITAGQVLTAKLILFIVALALPAAAAAAWAAVGLQGTPASVVEAALLMGSLTLLVSLAGAVLGALTGTLLRALFVAVGLGVGGSFLKVHFDALRILLLPSSPVFGRSPSNISNALGFIIMVAGGLAAAVMLLGYQYRLRRTLRSVALGVGIALTVWLCGLGWPWQAISSSLRHEIPQSSPPPFTVSLADTHVFLEQIEPHSYPLDDQVILGAQMTLGAAAGDDRLQQAQSRLTVNDGRVFTMPRPEPVWLWSPSDQPDDGTAPDGLCEALGLPARPGASRTYTVGLLTIPRSEYNVLHGVRGRLESWVKFSAMPDQVVGRAPLLPGSRVTSPGNLWRIRSVFQLPNGSVNVTVDTVTLRLVPPFEVSDATLLLLNTGKNEFADGEGPYLSGADGARSAVVVQSRSVLLMFRRTWSLSTRRKGSILDEDWLKNAEVLVIQWKERPMATTHFDWGEIELPTASTK